MCTCQKKFSANQLGGNNLLFDWLIGTTLVLYIWKEAALVSVRQKVDHREFVTPEIFYNALQGPFGNVRLS